MIFDCNPHKTWWKVLECHCYGMEDPQLDKAYGVEKHCIALFREQEDARRFISPNAGNYDYYQVLEPLDVLEARIEAYETNPAPF